MQNLMFMFARLKSKGAFIKLLNLKNNNPIIVIDDDEDDLALILEVVASLDLKNEIKTFNDPRAALEFFKHSSVSPFFILCDINMPAMTGLELRKALYEGGNIVLRSTPFLFLTTTQQNQFVNHAYMLNVQGYFTKPTSFGAFVALLEKIVSYWDVSVVPALLN